MFGDAMSNRDVKYVLDVVRDYNDAESLGASSNVKESNVTFNIEDLIKQFTIVCPDFNKLGDEKPNKALDFASKIISEIGPKSRSVKKGDKDSAWPLKFSVKNDTNEELYTVYVCTFKSSPRPTEAPMITDNKLVLTVEQAGLIALTIFSKVTPLFITKGIKIMTRLASAVFARHHIETIAEKLGQTVDTVLIIVNESCQTWGQYLPNSKSHVAAVAIICGTINLKKELKLKILKDIVERYLKFDKKFDSNEFLIYWENSFAQMPSGESLVKMFYQARGEMRASDSE